MIYFSMSAQTVCFLDASIFLIFADNPIRHVLGQIIINITRIDVVWIYIRLMFCTYEIEKFYFLISAPQ